MDSRRITMLFIAIALLLHLPAGASGLSGHNISNARNGLRDGDVLKRYPIVFTDTASAGTGCVWNLADIKPGKAYRMEIALVSESPEQHHMMRNRTAIHYRTSGDTILSTGFENNQWRVDFDYPEIWLADTMRLGFTTSARIHGTGKYCDRLRYAIEGRYILSADAGGTLIMPEGDTLSNVLRIHSQRAFIHKYYPKDSLNADITTEEFDHAAAMDSILILDTRRWYAPGYRYPLLEIQKLTRQADGAQLMYEACYTPADEMADIPTDPDNVKLRDTIRQNSPAPSDNDERTPSDAESGKDRLPSGGDDVNYRFTQQRGDRNLHVDYIVNHPMDIEFILADVAGIVYSSASRRCAPDETYSIDIPYGYSPGMGPYVLYISTGENRYAEKFHK